MARKPCSPSGRGQARCVLSSPQSPSAHLHRERKCLLVLGAMAGGHRRRRMIQSRSGRAQSEAAEAEAAGWGRERGRRTEVLGELRHRPVSASRISTPRHFRLSG
jgi:hypothetical protein